MKKLVQVQEVEGEGFMALLGERIVVFCLNYIYSGVLEGVNDKDILLKDAVVVYETGGLCDKSFKDAQPLPNSLYVRLTCVESYYKA
jgi:hypothetical protein